MSMVAKKRVRIFNKSGLHVKAATQMARFASQSGSRIKIISDGESVDATSLIGLLSLGLEYGSEFDIEVHGEDGEAVLKELERLIINRFGEEA